jgi:LCP family protein required for cell wall assembly
MSKKKSTLITTLVITLTVILSLTYAIISESSEAKPQTTEPTEPSVTVKPTNNSNDDKPDPTETKSTEETTAIDPREFKILETGKYSEKLVEPGTKSILLIGEDQENYLYDTVGIINIDKKNKIIKIIMIPRDMYIDYSQPIKDMLTEEGKLTEPGYLKLNCAHHVGVSLDYQGKFNTKSINFLHDLFIEKFDIDFADYVKINKYAVREFVDAFGGIEIDVPYPMHYDDPDQDLYIHFEEGRQHMDGEQAEGFIRFRQGLNEEGKMIIYGDVERKKNQIYFIKEMIKQHGTLNNINKIPEVLKLLGKNVRHSIGFGDILTSYTKIAADVVTDKYEIKSIVLEGRLTKISGSSYMIIE